MHGQSVNTGAPQAAAEVDVRFKTLGAMDDVMARIHDILKNY